MACDSHMQMPIAPASKPFTSAHYEPLMDTLTTHNGHLGKTELTFYVIDFGKCLF